LQSGAIPRWPLLAQTVMDGIRTDLGLRELLTLGLVAVQVNTANMEHLVLEPPMVSGHRRADGAAVQLPNWNLINPKIAELFGPGGHR
jgi:hypothetical protein